MNYIPENISASILSYMDTAYTANVISFREMLELHGIEADLIEFHWHVRTIKRTQGWIIHISSVIYQTEEILKTILPYLAEKELAFKIPIDKEAYRNILNGFLGTAQIGKLISIYPDSDEQALSVARDLINMTENFRGPAIPTDFSLGSIIYSRYGSFQVKKSIGTSGREEKYLRDYKGSLIIDEYHIPAKVPRGIFWPFSSIKKPYVPSPKRILHHFYKPVSFLKQDARGNVFKGLYVKNIFKVYPCVVKQGLKGMASEETGREIADRLQWQRILHTRLEGKIPLPKCIDYFEEDGDTYFVIEYINGQSLFDILKRVNFNIQTLNSLQLQEKEILLSYLLEVIKIIEHFHREGYVHRDIAPGNFMILENNSISLIDIELAYALTEKTPTPPFSLGTHGFMSPEQESVQTPTVKEDIYALGALILLTFTGLSPVKFNTQNWTNLYKNLMYFIGDGQIVDLITSCLNADPEQRPEIGALLNGVARYKNGLLEAGLVSDNTTIIKTPHNQRLREVIQAAIDGLVEGPMVMLNDQWYFKTNLNENFDTPIQKEFSRYPGLANGLSGVTYTLIKARNFGFSIEKALLSFKKAWEYIDTFSINDPNLSPGLYTGSAGIAVSLVKNLKAGMYSEDDAWKNKLTKYLDMPNTTLDIATGISGQGIALIRCSDYLEKEWIRPRLQNIIDTIIKHQTNRGTWIWSAIKNERAHDLSFSTGTPGIIWFLLEYYHRNNDKRSGESAKKGIEYILRETNDLKDLLEKGVFKNKSLKGCEKGDERTGIILVMIKAYEVFQLPAYKRQAETILGSYPPFIVNNNYTQETGLAGLGELYLEAWRVFQTPEWKSRADWIQDVFVHTFYKSSNMPGGYWKMEETNDPLADLMNGNTGVLHFLLNCYTSDKTTYRLLY